MKLKLMLGMVLLLFSHVAMSDNLTDSNKLFDWAETNYSQFFSPAGSATFSIDNYLVRYYADTDTYIGTTQQDDVYVYGDIWGGLLYVGMISDFIDTEPPPAGTYTIGDIGPSGGVVFSIDNSGLHGLEAQPFDYNEPNSGLIWPDAVDAASSYGSGWHLPTKDELHQLRLQKDVVGGFLHREYWSSTTFDADRMWREDFDYDVTSNDQDYITGIYYGASVRAVRAF